MPDDLLSAVRRLDSNDAPDVLKNHETERNVFPEESCIFIQNDTVGHFRVLGNHWESHATVANVRVEDALQRTLITDLPIVHLADALGNWQDLG